MLKPLKLDSYKCNRETAALLVVRSCTESGSQWLSVWMERSVMGGVPLGLVLGLILFGIFTSGINSGIKCTDSKFVVAPC